jgi:hypothetical protein
MRTAGHGYEEPGLDGPLDGSLGGSLPAFVERAQQDAQWQSALARLGYRQVKSAYAQQMRESPRAEIFFGVKRLNQYPTMEFVRAWMRSEKMRAIKRVRWTFLGAMLATIVAVITFTVSCQCIPLR